MLLILVTEALLIVQQVHLMTEKDRVRRMMPVFLAKKVPSALWQVPIVVRTVSYALQDRMEVALGRHHANFVKRVHTRYVEVLFSNEMLTITLSLT